MKSIVENREILKFLKKICSERASEGQMCKA